MGTLLDITLYAPSEAQGRAILNDTFQVAEHLDSVLSTWKPESPVSVFNRDTNTDLRPVDPHLYRVMITSQELSDKTDGAFNVTVRPLVEMWERAAKSRRAPTTREIAVAKRLIAQNPLRLSPPSSMGKKLPGVMIETGGIGKGYAIDEMIKLLRSRGVSQAFINFGRSSMAAIGTPPGASGWKTELALSEISSDGLLELRDETLSVSQARGTPFVVNGVAYAHIFDPRTAMPVKTARGAAVRGPSATAGEAFVKYLIIRGAPPPRVARKWGDVAWIVRNGELVERSEGGAGACSGATIQNGQTDGQKATKHPTLRPRNDDNA
jgi:thiamine biosynthesis lipoprotein